MKLNAGIITPKLADSKAFYTEVLNFGITFENDWFVLLHTLDRSTEIGFLLPDHPSQNPLFRTAFAGQGVYLTAEVDHVGSQYERIKAMGIPMAVDLREEPWGDHHFAIVDLTGIGVDIVTHRLG